jgi:hypothetical protein
LKSLVSNKELMNFGGAEYQYLVIIKSAITNDIPSAINHISIACIEEDHSRRDIIRAGDLK